MLDAVRWFLGEDNKLGRRFDPVRLAITEVSEKALSYGNVTDLKKDVRTLLGREEDRGLPYRELRDSFSKYRGLAVLLDDARIREALAAIAAAHNPNPYKRSDADPAAAIVWSLVA